MNVITFDGNYGNYFFVIKLTDQNRNSNYYPTSAILSPPKLIDIEPLPILYAKYKTRNKTLTNVPECMFANKI